MNCFNHPDNAAIGICKSCCKALCRHCAVEVENGLACRETPCEDRVKLINRIIDNNKRIIDAANTQNRLAATFTIALGVGMLAYGWLAMAAVGVYMAGCSFL